jgi:hypothetical protein
MRSKSDRRAQRVDEQRERRVEVLAEARQRQPHRLIPGVAADARRRVRQPLGVRQLVELLGALGEHRHAHAREPLLARRIQRRPAVERQVQRDQRQRVLLDQVHLDPAGQRERPHRRQPKRPRRPGDRLARAKPLVREHQLLRPGRGVIHGWAIWHRPLRLATVRARTRVIRATVY